MAELTALGNLGWWWHIRVRIPAQWGLNSWPGTVSPHDPNIPNSVQSSRVLGAIYHAYCHRESPLPSLHIACKPCGTPLVASSA